MIHYIRDSKNTTIAEIQTMGNDLSAYVSISAFCDLLLETPEESRTSLIVNFDNLQEIRGSYFDLYQGTPDVDEFVEGWCKLLAVMFDLTYVVD